MEEAAAADRAIEVVERLKAVGIPARMSDVGVTGDQLSGMAEQAFGLKRILRVNPRPVTQGGLLKSAL